MKKRILVAQNDKKTQDELVILLSPAYEVISPNDGLEALEIVTASDIHLDLVITDLELPRLTGLDLMKGVRKVDEWLPFIIVTGENRNVSIIIEAINLTTSGYLKRPFHPSELLKRVKRVLEERINPSRWMHPITRYTLTEINGYFSRRISLYDIACSLETSQENLCRLFQRDCHITPVRYIEKLRIRSAMRLLKNDEYSVEEVARLTGFSDLSQFKKTFKKYAGMSPEEFRLQKKGEEDEADLFFQDKLSQPITTKKS